MGISVLSDFGWYLKVHLEETPFVRKPSGTFTSIIVSLNGPHKDRDEKYHGSIKDIRIYLYLRGNH